jgi:hypothetical protein
VNDPFDKRPNYDWLSACKTTTIQHILLAEEKRRTKRESKKHIDRIVANAPANKSGNHGVAKALIRSDSNQ